jgi:DNA-binding transcriptional regulator YdaS (Cro superfamily)
MDLKEFIADADARAALAKKIKTHPGYLWQIATGWNGRQASASLAAKIEAATDGLVTKSSLRPDIWGSEKKAA